MRKQLITSCGHLLEWRYSTHALFVSAWNVAALIVRTWQRVEGNICSLVRP